MKNEKVIGNTCIKNNFWMYIKKVIIKKNIPHLSCYGQMRTPLNEE